MKNENHETFEQWVYRIRNRRKELIKNTVFGAITVLLVAGLASMAGGFLWWVWHAASEAHPGIRLAAGGGGVAIVFGILLTALTENW